MLIRGQRAPIVGRVSMDYTTVDVGHVRGVEVGDRATLIGADGHEAIRLEELAERAGTIPYEVSCAVGRRVPRHYLQDEELTLPQQPERVPQPSREPGSRQLR